MAEQDRNYLPLCAGSRERSSQGQMSLPKEKGPGNFPHGLTHSRFISEQSLSSVPTQAALGGRIPLCELQFRSQNTTALKGL